MKLNHFNATRTYARPVAITLLAAFACAFVVFVPVESISSPRQSTPVPAGKQNEDSQATMARRELERAPVAKLQTIKSVRLRRAILDARQLMVLIANNHSKTQEAVLLRNFDLKLKVLQGAAQSSEYKTGVFKCLGDYKTCVHNSCKFGCGCGFAFVGCLAIEIIHAIS